MATTLNHIAFDLLKIARGGIISDDDHISLPQVKFWINNTRAKLIRQDLEKRRSVNPDLVQSLGCVAVSAVDASECGCVTTGCEVVRTDVIIPNSVELHHKNLITSVGPINQMDRRFNFTSYERAIWANPNKYTASIPVAFLHNNFVYIIGKNIELVEQINIQGIFEDPSSVSTFKTCTGDTCYDDDSQYPIATYMVEDLKALILANNFKIAAFAPTDRVGDSSHDLKTNQTQE